MKRAAHPRSGLTLIELMITSALIGVLGLIVYSLLNTGTILGAKNTAVNTAHQQARVALLQMTQTLHTAVSIPQLIDANGNPTAVQPAAGISFQRWAGGPYGITADTSDAWRNGVRVDVTDTPFTGGTQRLVIPGYQIESNINALPANTTGSVTLMPTSTPAPTPIPVPIAIPPAPHKTICFLTDRCYYLIKNNVLEFHYSFDPNTGLPKVAKLATGIASTTPFTISNNAARIALSTFDSKSTNRGFHSSDLGLTETIPIRSNLTTLP